MSSLLDYCNSLLSGIADTDLAKLQSVQNWLAHVVTKSPKFTRSVSLLRSLQWLSVKFRADFKICLLTYKTLSAKQPVYLHSLLVTPLPSCSPRSNKGITLSVPRAKTNARKSHLALVPLLLGTACHYQPIHPLQFPLSGNVSRHIFSTWPFPPIDTGMPDDLLTLWNCFIDFAVEHWFGCRATETGYAGDIGAIEIW